MLRILVVSYDAGGANILSSLVKKYRNDFKWMTCVSGPASGIFLKSRKDSCAKPVYLRNRGIKDLIRSLHPDFILTGTGWASDFEIDFLKAAKAQNIKSASFLDHWCNYRERFGYPGDWKKNLPDFIFVGDKWAYDIALKNGFPKTRLQQVENPYFEEVIKEKGAILGCKKRSTRKQKDRMRVLFLSDPIYDHAFKYYRDPYYWGYTEYDIIRDLQRLMEFKRGIEVKIRLHPAEKKDKYLGIVNKKSISITTAYSNSLVKDCMWSDIVIGCDTTALIIACMLGKIAISYIPSVKMSCSLPQKEIHRIKSFNELMHEIKIFKKDNSMKNHRNAIVFNKAFLDFFKGINPCH